MPNSLSLRPVGLLILALVTLALMRWLVATPLPMLYAQTSPLATPWPTLVVTYSPVLPTVTPLLAPAATAVRANFIFHSPLPTPTAIPDFAPPQTTIQVTGVHSSTGWYRSPVSVTFAITDDFGAGVTAYQLDNAPAWTDREYYYPPLVMADDGVHTLAYQSIDRLHNREAPQTTQIRIDRTPPQAAVLAVDGNQLLNGWYNTPVQVTFSGSDALSGLAGFAQQTTAATWVESPATTTFATTGQQTINWRAVDNAGNVSTPQQTTVQVDLTPPTTTYTLDALPVNGWYTRSVMVTLNAVDVGAGVFQTQYRLNGEAGWRSYSGPFPVNGAGTQTVVYQSIDRALNTETPHTFTLPLDLAAPTLALLVSQPPATGPWYGTQITVTAQASDAQSGIADVAYALDGAAWQAYTTPLPFTTGVLHTVQFRATDQVGHVATSERLQLGVDTQPPTTTAQLSALPADAGWFGAPVTVTLQSTDTQTGVLHTHYRLNHTNWQPYTQPFVVNQVGTQTVAYYATDQVLNAETVHTLTLPIDLAAPTISARISTTATSRGWYRQAVSVTLQATDAPAGLASLQYQLDNSAWQPYTSPLAIQAGTLHIVQLRASDRAGHVASTDRLTLGVDGQPPTTTVQLSALPTAAGWFGAAVTVTLTSTDTQTGVLHTHYRLNNAAWQPYTQPFVVSQPSTQTLAYYALDQARNAATVHTLTLPIDLAAPLLTASVSPTQTSHSWYRQAVSVTLHAQDAQAGLERVQYQVDGADWQPYTSPLTVPPGAAHTVQFRALDRAGHVASTDVLTVGVDGQPPTTTLRLSQAPNAAGWLNQPVTLTLVATDTETGVFQTQSQWQTQAAPAIYRQPLRLAQEGEPTLTWFSIDRALNQEPAHTQTLHLDMTPPVITYTISGGSPLGAVATGWYQTAATVQVTATDALAGVAAVAANLDGGGWQPYTGPLTVTSGGQHTLQFQADDQAGNRSLINSTLFGIDTLAPVSTLWLDGGRAANGWYVTPVTVTLTTTDTGVGVATLQWRLNGGLWQNDISPFVVTSERINLLEYAALDKAGNQETQQFTVFSLDLQNPSSQVVVVQGRSGSNGWYVSPVALTLNGQDLESGLSHVEYQLDQQPWQTAPGSLALDTEGVHHLAYRARDAAGRVDATHTLTVSIDLTPPQIETTLPREVIYADISLTGLYTVTDAVSQIMTMTVRLNDEPYLSTQPLRLGENSVAISAINGAGLQASQVQPIFVRGAQVYLPLINAK